MPEDSAKTKAKPRGTARWTALAGLAIAFIAGVVLIIAGPGYRMGWWPLDTGFALLSVGLMTGLAAISISVIALMLSWYSASTRGRLYALAGVIVALVVIYVPYHWRTLALESPAIHDIATDPDHPLAFKTLAAARGPDQNSIAYGGAKVADMQRQNFPAVAPLISEQPPKAVFSAVMALVANAGWDVASIDANSMTIEATAQTFWFGFKDDIIIKVTPQGAGSRVDMRSQSRIGRGDAGTNARRVEQFLTALKKKLKS